MRQRSRASPRPANRPIHKPVATFSSEHNFRVNAVQKMDRAALLERKWDKSPIKWAMWDYSAIQKYHHLCCIGASRSVRDWSASRPKSCGQLQSIAVCLKILVTRRGRRVWLFHNLFAAERGSGGQHRAVPRDGSPGSGAFFWPVSSLEDIFCDKSLLFKYLHRNRA